MPLRNPRGPCGIVELFQRPGEDGHLHDGCFRFLEAAAELAGEFLRSEEVRNFRQRETVWGRLDRFTQSIHHGIDLAQTAYTIANEARAVLGCDRVTVVVCRGRKARVEAVSGQIAAQQRANVVRLLLSLAKSVIQTGEPLWYAGGSVALPPQIEQPLCALVDESHAQALAVIPLIRSRPETSAATSDSHSTEPPETVGALIVERINQPGLSQSMRGLIQQVANRSTAALANALDHQRVFLMPLWQTLEKMRWFVAARRLPKTVLATAAVAALVTAACIIPADFRISAQGTLQPAKRRDVFVQEPGVVAAVLVDHGDHVKAGAELLRLRSRELEVQLEEVTGRRNATLEMLRALRWSEGSGRPSQDERSKLSGQYHQLQKTYDSLTAQLTLLEAKREMLTVRSPIDGRVVTWDVRQRLQDRPVEKGQVLVTVASPDQWELELLVPEKHAGYIAAAWETARAGRHDLCARYILATDPAERRAGRVTEVQHTAEVRGEAGNTVLVRVAVNPADLQATQHRPGAAVTGQVDCGRRSLAYVWCYDVLAFVRSKILFRI